MRMKKETTKMLIIAFGSQISGKTHERSDYDFAVLARKPLILTGQTKLSQSF